MPLYFTNEFKGQFLFREKSFLRNVKHLYLYCQLKYKWVSRFMSPYQGANYFPIDFFIFLFKLVFLNLLSFSSVFDLWDFNLNISLTSSYISSALIWRSTLWILIVSDHFFYTFLRELVIIGNFDDILNVLESMTIFLWIYYLKSVGDRFLDELIDLSHFMPFNIYLESNFSVSFLYIIFW